MITRSARGSPGVVGISVLPSSALVAALGCAQILGIDGDYVRVKDGTASNSSGANGATVQDGRAPQIVETGGVSFGTGGVAPSGTGGGDTGGAVAETGGAANSSSGGTGGASPPAPTGGAPGALTACTPGRYQGALGGTHTSSLGIGFAPPVPLAGTVNFTLVPDGAGDGALVDGTIDGSVDLSSLGLGNGIKIKGTLRASVNCAAGTMTGTIDGGYAVPPAPPITFSGTHVGAFATGKFSGHWDETEIANTSYSGSGDWDAARTGP